MTVVGIAAVRYRDVDSSTNMALVYFFNQLKVYLLTLSPFPLRASRSKGTTNRMMGILAHTRYV